MTCDFDGVLDPPERPPLAFAPLEIVTVLGNSSSSSSSGGGGEAGGEGECECFFGEERERSVLFCGCGRGDGGEEGGEEQRSIAAWRKGGGEGDLMDLVDWEGRDFVIVARG